MDSINSWEVLNGLKSEILTKINKIIIFGENGSEVIFSTRDGKVFGFGSNRFGGLGFGHKNGVKEPKNIVELNDKQVIDFSYSSTHVLAKTKTGSLYSWGDNYYGQLGIGTNTSDYRPKLIHSLSDKCVIAISCGSCHTLVLTDDNELYGFGYNFLGQIGCGNTSDQLKPILINSFNNETVVSISCGSLHSLALTQTGNVYSWGWNDYGQLGIGNETDTNIPTKIVVSNALVFKQIVCGDIHSLLLSECGDVYAFGCNDFGSIGTGNEPNSCLPIKIESINKVKEISANFSLNISMAKLEDNTYLVWGQCLTENILKPMQTQFTSFNDVIRNHSELKITVKSIECYIKKINRSWDQIIESFDDKNISDISFKVGNKQIFVNKFILRLHSTHFRNKYSVESTEIRESSTDSVEDTDNIEVIDNYSYEVFYSYLKYIYTECVEIEDQYLGQLLILSIDHKEEDLIIECFERIFSSDKKLITFAKIVEILKQSIDNNMNGLKVKCIDRIEGMKSVENICNVYELSVEYGLNELENNCFDFLKSLANNDKQLILDTDSYKKLSDNIRVKVLEKLFKREYIEIE